MRLVSNVFWILHSYIGAYSFPLLASYVPDFNAHYPTLTHKAMLKLTASGACWLSSAQGLFQEIGVVLVGETQSINSRQ